MAVAWLRLHGVLGIVIQFKEQLYPYVSKLGVVGGANGDNSDNSGNGGLDLDVDLDLINLYNIQQLLSPSPDSDASYIDESTNTNSHTNTNTNSNTNTKSNTLFYWSAERLRMKAKVLVNTFVTKYPKDKDTAIFTKALKKM